SFTVLTGPETIPMTRYALLAMALTLAACGGSTSGLNTAEIQAFNASAQGVSAAVTTYGTQASAMTSVATCTSAETSYDTQVRPMVGQMQGMGADMDAMMGTMNHVDAEDMGCSANAMLAELNRHQAVACASTTDMTPNKNEAQPLPRPRLHGWDEHGRHDGQRVDDRPLHPQRGRQLHVPAVSTIAPRGRDRPDGHRAPPTRRAGSALSSSKSLTSAPARVSTKCWDPQTRSRTRQKWQTSSSPGWRCGTGSRKPGQQSGSGTRRRWHAGTTTAYDRGARLSYLCGSRRGSLDPCHGS
ncbi:MAG: hypothetical protein H6Q28_1271, partial [Bacteroidetes bacterium]|nr:hypothetical protein [Bacteroidota bacterium]